MKTLNFPIAINCESRKTSNLVPSGPSVSLVLALLCVFAFPVWARPSQQDPSKEKVGDLTSNGEVRLNDSPISVLSTVSSGDKIRTGESGEATLAVAGKRTLKIHAQSQVILSANDQYTAELEKGTVSLNALPGSDGLIVRIGNYVVVPSVRSVATALRAAKAEDGSFVVYCLEGKIGVLTIEGKSGQLLEAGQSLPVSANSALLASSSTPKSKANSHKGWILLGVAGAAAAGLVAAFAHHGGNQTVTIP